MKLKSKVFVFLFTAFFSIHSSATILDSKEAETADLPLSIGEIASFRSIGMSIALSIAKCNNLEPYSCPFAVEEGEIRELIEVLNVRINGLIAKQAQAEDTENLNKLLAAYINERYNYSAYLEKLSRLNALKFFEDEGINDDEDILDVSEAED